MANLLTDDNFEQHIEKANLALVDFFAPWCPPCKMMEPILEQVEKLIVQDDAFSGKFDLYKINIDENPKIPSIYGIMSIPTLILFKNGKQIDSKLGVQQKDTLIKWIKEHLN